ncbi:DNA primase [Aquimarina sp. AD10]|uniref:DNA primase n=1 Tax=Aquimarina aggregata TaxID=1642818 RepID=A0A162YDJ1_9FLAO|nr:MULTISPECIES: DNA primase [Aquimarina]AXT60964.1 DNA primase [Aquimarina sp. AD10]KZS39067.1 DNA primase [Aquimarina aggregata]RKM95606.1 DNA primase [Aquimarina sp. AD10]
MIHKSTIDAVFEAVRLEEVIGDFVQLKKSGSNFKGLSPFSEERTPSFMVSPVKQIWKDFSSGKGGNAVAFLMEHEHFTYPEAIKYLAKKYNIEIEETEQTDEQKQQADERESMYLVSEFANTFFQNSLHKTEKGKAIGLTYFKERGFTDETIKKFGLGYSPDVWDAFTAEAIKKGYKLEYLEKTGLTIVKEEKQFDRFKGRVMFPIQSMSGRVLGFGGRILTNEKKAAKYLNSPESDIYHKSKVLYGIYHAKQAIAKEDNCFLVEGYTDVIQFNQTGVSNVVSSSGTALTSDQIRLINRLTKNITVLFDSDAAGMRASIRGIDLILEQGMNVKVCSFPEGEDPDSFAKQNTLEELTSYLEEHSQDFISFKASLLQKESKNDPIKKAELIRDMVTSISKIPDVIKREIYVRECSRIMDISEDVLFDTLAQIRNVGEKDQRKQQKKEQKSLEVVKTETPKQPKVNRQYVLERHLIKALLMYGVQEEEFEDLIMKENEEGELVLEPEIHKIKVFEKIYLDLQDDEVEFTDQVFKDVYAILIEELNQVDEFKVENFINKIPPEIASEITEIMMNEERYELHRWADMEIHVKQKTETIAEYVNTTILSLRGFLIDQKIQELSQEVKAQNIENNMNVLEDIRDYQILKKLLYRKLNRVI